MKISILIATYRGADRIKKLLQSMLDNNLVEDINYEILIFDDGSPIEDYSLLLSNVLRFNTLNCVVQQVPHGGWISTANKLVEASKGDIVLFLDDDVLYSYNLLYTVRGIINSLDNVGVLSWRSYGDRPGQSKVPRPGFLQPATELAGYCMAFKKTLWQKLNGFDSRFNVYCSDSDFALRATLSGYPSYRVWWPLIVHEEHGCFNNAPELNKNKIAESDLMAFKEKWGATGSEMEIMAINNLMDGK